jgi:hypothetical protein
VAFVQSLAAGLFGRRAARRIGKMIPNPVLRFVVVTAVTTAVPLAVNRLRRSNRRK